MRRYQLSKKRLKYLMLKQKINWKLEKGLRPIFYVKNFGGQFTREVLFEKDRITFLELCYNYLVHDFSDIIEKYKKLFLEIQENTEIKKEKYIWICWFQGGEDMPDIVRTCIGSIKKNVGDDIKIIVLTVDNLYEYVSFPKHISEKVYNGRITLTHFSDMVRFELLSRYGGLWIDATVYAGKEIPGTLMDQPLYSIQYPREERNDFYGCLTSFLIGGNFCGESRLIFSFMLEVFYAYWAKYSVLLDWHLVNIVYAMLYRNIPQARKLIDQIGVTDNKVQALAQIANQPYDDRIWNELMSEQRFHKMNWRKKYAIDIENTKTFYGKMKQEII